MRDPTRPPMPSLQQALDSGPFTAFQAHCVAIAVLAVVLDGFDIQLLGAAMPALMKDWALDKAAFVPVIGLGLLAMSMGTAISGWLGDRIGRRPCLIGAMVIFGAATLAAAATTSLPGFFAARVAASLGLGGAMPVAVAMLAEFTPRRHRSLAVTGGMICTPIGGLLVGVISAWVLPRHGWQALFAVGGVLPLVLAVVLALSLPESAAFLAAKGRHADLQRMAAKLGASVAPMADAAPPQAKGQFTALFRGGLASTSVLIWCLFLGGLTAAYTIFNWLPTLLVHGGQAMSTGNLALAAFNFGGILGTVVGALVLGRWGSRRVITAYALAGAGSVVLAAWVLGFAQTATPVEAAMAAAGFCMVGVQTMLFALASHAYPDHLRATGVGAALGVGRLGALASSAIGSMLVGWGATGFFGFLAGLMGVVAACLLLLAPHIPPSHGDKA